MLIRLASLFAFAALAAGCVDKVDPGKGEIDPELPPASPLPGPADGKADGVGNVVQVAVESAHPYTNDLDRAYPIELAGRVPTCATTARVHFPSIRTEAGYDFVHLEGATGRFQSFDGNRDNLWSEWGALGATKQLAEVVALRRLQLAAEVVRRHLVGEHRRLLDIHGVEAHHLEGAAQARTQAQQPHQQPVPMHGRVPVKAAKKRRRKPVRRQRVGIALAVAGATPQPPYALHLSVWMPDAARRDLSNTIKALEDAIFGVLHKDDSTVVELHAYKRGIDRKRPRIDVVLEGREG